jgi:hypothetical protein
MNRSVVWLPEKAPARPEILVSRPRSSLYISASHRRRWQGGTTMEYWEYSEEAQRRQRRRGPTRYVTNFWDGTLCSDKKLYSDLRGEAIVLRITR